MLFYDVMLMPVKRFNCIDILNGCYENIFTFAVDKNNINEQNDTFVIDAICFSRFFKFM
jgi:hypothetical protein